MATISARDAALLGLGAGMGYLLARKVLGKMIIGWQWVG